MYNSKYGHSIRIDTRYCATRQMYNNNKGGLDRELNWKEKGRATTVAPANFPWKIMTSARGGEGSVHQHEVLLWPPIVRFLKTYASFRVVGQRRRHVDHFRFLLSFNTLAYNNRAYSTRSNFASFGSWKFRSMLRSIRRGPLSFFHARARILSKAAGGLMHPFVAVNGIKISIALL